MTLDEAIKHAEEVAEENEKNAKSINNIYKKSCLECADEHRQLAEWLMELNKLRDFANFVAESVMSEDFDENSDFYAEAFCRKLYKMGFIEISDDKWILNNEEVNTDATND